jgi:hypothetical protein
VPWSRRPTNLLGRAPCGLAILWTYAVVAWPIVLDPVRRGERMAAIVTFGLALACLVAARYVLPSADRLEGRALVDAEH